MTAFLLLGLDIERTINAVGYPGLFLIVFAETGLLIGFFLPGDTLLITTGILCERGNLELFGQNGVWFVIPLLIIAAVLGDAVGYQIGRHTGPRIFTRDDSRWFNRRHLLRAKDFYEKHGGKTIVFARWLAFVRTFAPTVAGAAEMSYPRFALYNISGGAAWVLSMVLLGFVAGKAIPNVELLIILLVGGMFTLSIIPAALHLVRERRAAARARANPAP
jgi:membrane-associated protein